MSHVINRPERFLRAIKVILVVEDDEDVGAFFVEALQAETGYHFVLAKDAVQALKSLHAVIPDLVILDYALPGMNGLELYDRIISMHDFEGVPTLLMSANVSSQEVKKRHIPFIAKPFELDKLIEKIDELLAA